MYRLEPARLTSRYCRSPHSSLRVQSPRRGMGAGSLAGIGSLKVTRQPPNSRKDRATTARQTFISLSL
ncbi:hypothetical protein D3C72_2438190 [compost metagenome]